MHENELKFAGDNHRVGPIMSYLLAVCREEADYPEGIVSSVYFDSINCRSLAEKLNSDYLKVKYRVRWYGDTKTGAPSPEAFAEAKFKVGTRRIKERVKLTEEQANVFRETSLDSPEFPRIASIFASTGAPIEPYLLPILTISYRRRRLVEPRSGLRISVDTDINVPKINQSLAYRSAPLCLNSAVVEVKGEVDTIPGVLYPITTMGFKKTSMSKYKACFEKIARSNSGLN